MDREAFDKLSQADRDWLILELLVSVHGRADDIAEMLLAEIVEESFPPTEGNA